MGTTELLERSPINRAEPEVESTGRVDMKVHFLLASPGFTDYATAVDARLNALDADPAFAAKEMKREDRKIRLSSLRSRIRGLLEWGSERQIAKNEHVIFACGRALFTHSQPVLVR